MHGKTHVSAGVCEGQKRALDPLQLELWVVVSLLARVLGFLQEQQAFLTIEHLSSPLISTSQIRHLHCNFMMNIGFVI